MSSSGMVPIASPTARFSAEYKVGFSAREKFRAVIGYARSLGLIVEDNGSGWPTRSGWLVVKGPSDDLDVFIHAWEGMTEAR